MHFGKSTLKTPKSNPEACWKLPHGCWRHPGEFPEISQEPSWRILATFLMHFEIILVPEKTFEAIFSNVEKLSNSY